MGENDVDKEDAKKHDPDLRDSIKGPEINVLDAKMESTEEGFPSVVGDSNKSDSVGEDHKLENATENKITGGTEMADEMKSESKISEPMNVDRSSGEQINTESKNEEISNTHANVEGQTDARNKVVEQNNVNAGVIEESSTVNGVEGADVVKNVEENPTGDAAAEKPVDGGREDGDATAVKPIDGGREDGDATAVKPKDTGREDGDSAAEKPEDTKREDGDAAVEKTKDTGREDRDAAAEKPEGTGTEEEDSNEHVTRKEMINENADTGNDTIKNEQIPTELSLNRDPQSQNAKLDEVLKVEDKEVEDATKENEGNKGNDKPKEQGKELLASPVIGENVRTVETATKQEGHASSLPNQHEDATPSSLVLYSSAKAGDHSGETIKTVFNKAALPLMAEDDDGTPEEQAAFMKEIESFYRERAMDFKPPKFYGQPLNCLKLWRAVIRLGGYDRVTGSKLWRQVGESFHPPKTCTTVSWTFRIFYEKSLLEYEKHKRQSGELQLPVVAAPEASGADSEGSGYQGSGAGRARRDAAARAMQGWHVQRLFDNGEVGEPVIKDKNLNNMAKQKNVKSIGSLKQKRPNEVEQLVKAARTESSKQLATSVIDVGPPADWVKINIRQTKDCFEVYALVPGLLREEVRVQSDPAGRLVITGQPEQVDNAWGITPFKKVVNLPARIDPLQTSAVVSLHGRLFVRVPFEQSNA